LHVDEPNEKQHVDVMNDEPFFVIDQAKEMDWLPSVLMTLLE